MFVEIIALFTQNNVSMVQCPSPPLTPAAHTPLAWGSSQVLRDISLRATFSWHHTISWVNCHHCSAASGYFGNNPKPFSRAYLLNCGTFWTFHFSIISFHQRQLKHSFWLFNCWAGQCRGTTFCLFSSQSVLLFYYTSSADKDLSSLLWEFFHVNNIFGLAEHSLCFLSPRMAVILC